jgi:hypothetical protein
VPVIGQRFPEVCAAAADDSPMVNPVSANTIADYSSQLAKTATSAPPPKTQSADVQDTVKLASTFDVDHDGDSK